MGLDSFGQPEPTFPEIPPSTIRKGDQIGTGFAFGDRYGSKYGLLQLLSSIPTDGRSFLRAVGGYNENNLLVPINLTNAGALVVTNDSGSLDAFGRNRESTPVSIFDSKQLYEKDTLFWTEALTGGATSVFQTNESSVELTVSSLNDKVIRQTRQYFPYHPGQGQLLIMTGVIGAPETGVVKRIGYFDDDNGLFFEQASDGTLNVVVRSSTSGSPVDTRIAQTDWNRDTADGSGASGFSLDPTNLNIFIIDFGWLGGGSVRFSIQSSGRAILLHEVENENSLPTVYMTTPVLPIRYEIEATGSPAAASTLHHVCASAFSEGVEDPLGLIVSDNLGASATTINDGASVPILSIRPKPDRIRATLEILEYSANPTAAADFLVEIYIGGTVTGGTYVDSSPHSQINKTAASFSATGATRIFSRYGSSTNQNQTPQASNLKNALKAGASIDGATVDPITLVITNFTNPSADYRASLTWKELH